MSKSKVDRVNRYLEFMKHTLMFTATVTVMVLCAVFLQFLIGWALSLGDAPDNVQNTATGIYLGYILVAMAAVTLRGIRDIFDVTIDNWNNTNGGTNDTSS